MAVVHHSDPVTHRYPEQVIPDDQPEEAKAKSRDLKENPPEEGNAAETTIDELNLDQAQSLFYQFDFGDSCENHIEIEAIRQGSRDDPKVINTQGDSPRQYFRRDA